MEKWTLILKDGVCKQVPAKCRHWEESEMIKKSYTKTGKVCRVTFKLPAEVNAKTAVLCGDFNDWDTNAPPMKSLKDGCFSTTVSLPTEKLYCFRYLLDGTRWENDWEADTYIPNQHGSDDSVVEV